MPNGDTCNEATGESWRVVTAPDGTTILADLMTGVTWTKLTMLDDSDPDALAAQLTAPAWASGTDYATDALVTDASGTVWICRQRTRRRRTGSPARPEPSRSGSASATPTPSALRGRRAPRTRSGRPSRTPGAPTPASKRTRHRRAGSRRTRPRCGPCNSRPAPGEWTYPVAYAVGDLVTYQGTTYKCLQAHTSQAGWTPSAVPALWQPQ